MREIEMVHSCGDVSRLLGIQRARLALPDGAKAAMTRADVAAQHERSGAIGPTLKNVWATRFLADGVQVQTFNQLQHLVLVGRVTETDAKPFGLGLTDFLIVTDNSEFAGQLFTSGVILLYKLRRSESSHRRSTHDQIPSPCLCSSERRFKHQRRRRKTKNASENDPAHDPRDRAGSD